MADETKKYLIDIESNINQYTKEAVEAREAIDKLTVENLKLRNSGKASAEEIERSNSQLRAAQIQYRNAKKNIDNMTLAQKANKGSYQELYQSWKTAQTQLKLMGNAYTVNDKGVRVLSQAYVEQSKKVADAKKSLDEFGKGVNDNRLNVGSYAEGIEQAFGNIMPASMRTATTGIKSMNTAFKALLANPIVLFIAGIAAALSTLIAYFKRTEDGQNKLSKITAALSSVFQNLLDIVGNIGEKIFWAFEHPKEAIQSLWDAIKTNIVNRFLGVVEMFQAGGEIIRNGLMGIAKSVQGIFDKEARDESKEYFAQSKEAAKDFGNATLKTLTGVDDLAAKVRDGFKALGEELSEDAKRAKALSDAEAALRKKERTELVENEKIRREILQLRAEAEQNKLVDAEQSLEAYERMFELENQILADEVANANERARIARERAELSQSDIDTLDEVARLEAEVIKKETEYAEKIKQNARFTNTVKREAFKQNSDLRKAEIEGITQVTNRTIAENDRILKDTQATYDEKLNALEANLRLRQSLSQEQLAIELEALKYEYDLGLLNEESYQAQRLALTEKYNTENAKLLGESIDATIALNLKRAQEARAIEAEIYKQNFEDAETNVALREQLLDQEYQALQDSVVWQNMTDLQKLQSDRQYTETKKALSEQRIAQVNQERQAVANALGSISDTVGKQTLAGKLFAVAQATINTWVAASQALADPTIPSTIARIATMISVVATGLNTVRNIMKVDTSGKGAGSTGSISSATPSTQMQRSFAQNLTPAMYALPQLSQPQLNAQSQQTLLTADDIAAAISKMPPPVVTVEDINARVKASQRVEARARI
jgi:hypothetical protein